MNFRRIRQSLMVTLLLASVAVSLRSVHGQDQRSHKRQETAVRVISDLPWHKWLNEDVRYIITDEERSDFKKLTTNDQRDKFVEDFWNRRNPTPQSSENPYKEEHYRRIAYTNQHFAADLPGWKTDRGRMYIMFGPPDSIESHPGFSPPSEVWRYSYIKDIGKDVTFEFVDTCKCGEYHMALHPQEQEKDPPEIKESFPQP
jgi:GWxTD domain-containing protein